METSPLLALSISSRKASSITSRGGIPAVPKMVSAVLRSTDAAREMVGPAVSPIWTGRVSDFTTKKSGSRESRQQCLGGRAPDVVQHHLKSSVLRGRAKAAANSAGDGSSEMVASPPTRATCPAPARCVRQQLLVPHPTASQSARPVVRPRRLRQESGPFLRARVAPGASAKARLTCLDWEERPRPKYRDPRVTACTELGPQPYVPPSRQMALEARQRTPACRPGGRPTPSSPHTTGSLRGVA